LHEGEDNMQITIPADAEALVKSRAAAAGFNDVSEYVITLIFKESGKESRGGASPPSETAYDAAKRLGLIGGCKGGPSDLATNPRHMEGFGR
jgi:hypothetical protein